MLENVRKVRENLRKCWQLWEIVGKVKGKCGENCKKYAKMLGTYRENIVKMRYSLLSFRIQILRFHLTIITFYHREIQMQHLSSKH